MHDFEGRTAVITGAASGIGLALAAAAFDGIAARRLYIVPHAKVLDAVVRHAQDLAAGVNPPPPRL